MQVWDQEYPEHHEKLVVWLEKGADATYMSKLLSHIERVDAVEHEFFVYVLGESSIRPDFG